MTIDLATLESRLGHAFGDPALAEEAITHSSYANELGKGAHYERLEFLGDAVLGLVAADFLFARHREQPEGELSRSKADLVSSASLAAWAEAIALGDSLRLGVGEERAGGRGKSSLLADVVEALFGAVYLDAGFDRARDVVARYLDWAISRPVEARVADAKTTLQELAQSRGWDLPAYSVVGESGPDHDKLFSVEVRLRGESGGTGSGRTKKAAEQAAAAAAIAALAEDSGPPVDKLP
ncbi:MAG: ribonuclease III [Thermoanaerobaculia bacterium]